MHFLPRNIYVWDAHATPPVNVAGLYQHGAVSVSLFFSWLNMILDIDIPWALFPADKEGDPIGEPLDHEDDGTLPFGNYAICSEDARPIPVSLLRESHRPRLLTMEATPVTEAVHFRDRVRARDNRCCVTGIPVQHGDYAIFHASHIFPVVHKDTWDEKRFKDKIQDDASIASQGPDGINSIQNGVLLRTDIHDMFNNYDFGINPDDEYQVIDFTSHGKLHGRSLWINMNVGAKYRPSDALLRDHLRQCVLAHVKGQGRRADWFDFELTDLDPWGKKLLSGH
ncbi:hypothetical protein BKA93DRAFT_852366 [Sparassis latifolia]